MGALRAIGSVIPEAKAMRSPKLHAKELHAKEHPSKKFRSTAARHLPLVALVATLFDERTGQIFDGTLGGRISGHARDDAPGRATATEGQK